MYFTFENPQYDDIMKKNHKDYPDDEIKFEFSYYVESDLKVLKYYSSNSEDKKKHVSNKIQFKRPTRELQFCMENAAYLFDKKLS